MHLLFQLLTIAIFFDQSLDGGAEPRLIRLQGPPCYNNSWKVHCPSSFSVADKLLQQKQFMEMKGSSSLTAVLLGKLRQQKLEAGISHPQSGVGVGRDDA